MDAGNFLFGGKENSGKQRLKREENGEKRVRESPKENLYFSLQIGIFSIFRYDGAHILETQLQKVISIFNSKSLFILQTFIF